MVNKKSFILITGSDGFVGKNLVSELKNQGYENLCLYDIDTPSHMLEEFAKKAHFVYHLAGVNRPKDTTEFYTGNSDLTKNLVSLFAKHNNKSPVLLCSSVQAELDNDYGKSKLSAEQTVFAHEKSTTALALVYRLPGLFGKWCRPSYNSVIATFCHNIANGLDIEVRDRNYTFPVCYIDDVVKTFVLALEGKVIKNDGKSEYCFIECVYDISLGFLADTLKSFALSRQTLAVCNMSDSLTKKLYSTYLSYLPYDKFSYPLKMNIDERGSFTEFLRTEDRGQVSINISKPNIVKGNHWHHSKNEKFLVVKGNGVIRFRKIDEDKIHEYFVNGDKLAVVNIPPGYTHNIENLGDADMVTVMWVNEPFDKDEPDTYFLKV